MSKQNIIASVQLDIPISYSSFSAIEDDLYPKEGGRWGLSVLAGPNAPREQ